jgi:hypothetical protein
MKNHFAYLLIALLGFLLITPVLGGLELGPFVKLIYIPTFVVAMWSMLGVRRWFTLGVVLAVAGLMAIGIDLWLDVNASHFAIEAIFLAFLVLICLVAMRQVLFAREVDANRLVGAVCVYLLLGIIWAILYRWTWLFVPEAFSGIPDADQNVWDFVYYSFVTLTTLGYGDVLPLTDLARTLAYLEAVTGVFYLAILVATLVGALLAQRLSQAAADQ